ncbi:MAG: YfhO family protein [Desulfobulbaceae bacterium]|nr:YfhO family protein [Desulfobulbaceae bacterium]
MISENFRNNGLVVAIFAVATILFCLPVLGHINNWGIQDWDWFLLYDGVTSTSVLKYGQMPLWNPYMKGGMPLLANPESNIFSPSFLVQLFCNEILAAKINIALHVFIGLGGTYALARHYRLGLPAALLAAGVFMLNSMYSLALTAGMEWGYSIALMPWALLFYLKSYDKFNHALTAALILVLMWLGGGVYPFTITLLLLGTYGLMAVISKEFALNRTIIILATIYGFTFALGAIKFLPAMELTQQHTRYSDLYAGLSLESLFYGLFGRDQNLAAILDKSHVNGFWRGFSQGMDETGMYVGLLPVAFFVVGTVNNLRRFRSLLICLVVFLWLATGDRSAPFSIWALLKGIPPYSIMRSIERFRFVAVLVIALLAGVGLEAVRAALARKFNSQKSAALLTGLVVALVFCDLLWVNGRVFRDAFPIPPLETPKSAAFVQIGGLPEYDRNGSRLAGEHDLYTSFGAAYPAWLANAGSVYAYESMPVPEKAVIMGSPDYRGEVFLEGTSGTARYGVWSPNRLVVEVQALGEGMLIINQNYYPGWQATGTAVESVRGLLGVRVGPQTSRVELYYRPASFVVGALISCLAVLAAGGWLWVSGRRPDLWTARENQGKTL